MVEGTALEMRRARKGTVGSNPTLSAIALLYFQHGKNKDRAPYAFWWRMDCSMAIHHWVS